jgi:hypothetical protein
MRTKKLLALLLAGAMVFGMNAVTAYATPVTDATGSSTGEGTGDVDYVDTKVFEVILPTTSAWDFTLDPQGLVGLKPGQSADSATLKATAGKIHTGASAPTAINRSSRDIVLTLGIAATAAAGGGTAPTLVQAVADVEPSTPSTAMNVLLAVIPSTLTVTSAAATFAGTNAYALTSSNADFTFLLEKANYEFKNAGGKFSYERKEDSNGNGTQFQLAGLVNREADWSDFGTLSVAATFSFAEAVTTTGGNAENASANAISGAYGMFHGGTAPTNLNASTTAVEVMALAGGGGASVGFTNATASIARSTWVAIDFNYGGLTVTGVTVGGSAITTANYRTTQMASNKIEFTFGSAGTRAIEVTMSDGSKHTISITVA